MSIFFQSFESAPSKRELFVVIGSFGFLDPIGIGRRGIDVVRGAAVVNGRTILAVLNDLVDAAQKGQL